MDVMNAEQARVAEEAGAVAVMALERVPADIRAHGGVARMSAPELIKSIKAAVTIPVLAKARIGHVVCALSLFLSMFFFLSLSLSLCLFFWLCLSVSCCLFAEQADSPRRWRLKFWKHSAWMA